MLPLRSAVAQHRARRPFGTPESNERIWLVDLDNTLHDCYMNASRLARIFVCVDRHRWVAALYPALLQHDALRAPMKSADMHLLLLASSKIGRASCRETGGQSG